MRLVTFALCPVMATAGLLLCLFPRPDMAQVAAQVTPILGPDIRSQLQDILIPPRAILHLLPDILAVTIHIQKWKSSNAKIFVADTIS
jgi:hypothetical protein